MVLMKTARLANYCWMLNEGIVLFQMIYAAFRVRSISMLKFHVIGWVLPVVIMIIYSVVHYLTEFDRSCWTNSMGYLELIYTLPPISFIVVCLLSSSSFFIVH